MPNAIDVVSQEIVWVSMAGGTTRCMTSIAVTVAGAIATPASGSLSRRAVRGQRAVEFHLPRTARRSTISRQMQRHPLSQHAVGEPVGEAGRTPQSEKQAAERATMVGGRERDERYGHGAEHGADA